MAPSLLQRCLASLLVTQCSLGDKPPPSVSAAAAARISHHGTTVFVASPGPRPGDGSGCVHGSGGGGLQQALREARPRDSPTSRMQHHYHHRHQRQQQQWRLREHATVSRPAVVAATTTTTTPPTTGASLDAYKSVGSRPQQFTCWSKDQWTPNRERLFSGQGSRRQRTTHVTWAKCQWSPSQRPSAGFLDSQGTTSTRLRGDAEGKARGGWSKSQWSPREWQPAKWTGSPSSLDSTRFGGEGGGVGGGAGVGVAAAGAGAGGGGSFTRSSFPPPAATGATNLGRGRDTTYRAPQAATVTRPAVAAATIGSSGPRDLSNAPVEVIDTAERYFQVLKENSDADKIVVIKIYAGFCRACKAFDRKFRSLSLDFEEQGANVKFFEMDWMQMRDLCKSLQEKVKKLPHLEMYVGDRGRLESFVCGPSKSGVLKEKIDKLIADPKDPSLGDAPIPDPEAFSEPPPPAPQAAL